MDIAPTTKHVKHMVTHWRWWLRGLITAAISGGANAITVTIIRPQDFNFDTGWSNLWHFTAISALVSVAIWLKSNPVPPISDETMPPFNPSP